MVTRPFTWLLMGKGDSRASLSGHIAVIARREKHQPATGAFQGAVVLIGQLLQEVGIALPRAGCDVAQYLLQVRADRRGKAVTFRYLMGNIVEGGRFPGMIFLL